MQKLLFTISFLICFQAESQNTDDNEIVQDNLIANQL